MQNTRVDVSVIIPAKNEGHIIGRCLEAVYGQDTGYTIEIIVIDSGSTDDTTAVVKKYPSITLLQIKPEEFGHGKTRNMGAETAKGTYIVFLNADALPVDNHWLNALIQPLEKDRETAGVFSRHIPNPDCYLYMVRDLRTAMPDREIPRTAARRGDSLLFSTVSAAMHKETWRRFPFKNDIIIAEDRDWAQKVLAKGKKILYQPASMVRHSHNYTPRELMESKRKIALASGRFKHKFSALTAGFVLISGGIVLKFIGDTIFILFKTRNMPFSRRIKEIKISLIARIAGFYGHYKGWACRELASPVPRIRIYGEKQ
ncbi:MAG: glycosyltransferase family 2 protein [bacterium]|nr:glycosyltransferase family 2 protein [bacterium]